MPVGGVRIEDDILITSRGYENLTKAPKGDAMFDIIRGLKFTHNTAQQRSANPRTGVNEPPLFRAPGCPLRATPLGLHPIKHASTMPNQTSECQRAETDRRNYALHIRHSMTTDERVQHWRQSHQPLSLRKPTTDQEKPNTMCGASTNNVKHVSIGDGPSDTLNTRSLPRCTDCAILAQTLERLRQNLALSKQGSPTQTHATQDAFSQPAQNTIPSRIARQDLNKPSQKTVETSINALQQDSHPRQVRTGTGSRQTEQARARQSLPQMLQLQKTQPKQLRATVFTVPESLSYQEPESFYRNHEQYQSPVRQGLLVRHTDFTTQAPILRSHMSMPIRARMAQQQGRRRLSNHTDDHD